MSHRAIQRLRQERETQIPAEIESEDEEEDEDNRDTAGVSTAFAAMMHDDSDSSSDEDDDSGEEEDDSDQQAANEEDEMDAEGDSIMKESAPTPSSEEQDAENAEDLDALLERFKEQDEKTEMVQPGEHEKPSWFDIITARIESRDLDIDYVMRTSLLGSTEDAAARSNRRGRQAQIFGPPRDNWPRPPHYVGGGMGMASYDNDQSLPWPYSDMKEGDGRCPELERWFKFTYADSYLRDCEDYERIKASGDPNALAMFIAHHPFIVEPLLQLSSVLYQTNQSQEGLSLLKRALWVFECASLNSFLKVEGRVGFMDHDQSDSQLFFSALFQLIRVSRVAGLPRASLAVSKFLLSLDPMRDPMGVLLGLDHFALLSNTENNDAWLVEFVESQKIGIFYKDDTSDEGYQGGLLDLPNWGFSYAMALFRSKDNQQSPHSESKANEAIKSAMRRFPSVLQHLLTKNEVNVTGRSFQTDWPSVLAYASDLAKQAQNALSDAAAADPVVRACTSQACETIVHIFVRQNFKLWSSDAVLQWLYRNLLEMKESEDVEVTKPLSPALMRYARCDPSDYDDKFQTMPADANPLDAGTVAHALNVDPNRPRLMQRMPRGGADELELAANRRAAAFAGPPTQAIDPDWPLLEVFWRSALPWAHVEGVPPPRR